MFFPADLHSSLFSFHLPIAASYVLHLFSESIPIAIDSHLIGNCYSTRVERLSPFFNGASANSFLIAQFLTGSFLILGVFFFDTGSSFFFVFVFTTDFWVKLTPLDPHLTYYQPHDSEKILCRTTRSTQSSQILLPNPSRLLDVGSNVPILKVVCALNQHHKWASS